MSQQVRYAISTGANRDDQHRYASVAEYVKAIEESWGMLTYCESLGGDEWVMPHTDHDMEFDSEADARANEWEWVLKCVDAVKALFVGKEPDLIFARRPLRAKGRMFKLSLRIYVTNYQIRPCDMKTLINAVHRDPTGIKQLFDTSIYAAGGSRHLLFTPGTRKPDTDKVMEPVALDRQAGRLLPLNLPLEPGVLERYICCNVESDMDKLYLPEWVTQASARAEAGRGSNHSAERVHNRYVLGELGASGGVSTDVEQRVVAAMKQLAPAYGFHKSEAKSLCFRKVDGGAATCPYGNVHESNNTCYCHLREDGLVEVYCCGKECAKEFKKRPIFVCRHRAVECAFAPPPPSLSPTTEPEDTGNKELWAARQIASMYRERLVFSDGLYYIYDPASGLWMSEPKVTGAQLLNMSNAMKELGDLSPQDIRHALQNLPPLVSSPTFLEECDTASLNFLHYTNGVLDLHTFTLLPHHPKYRFVVSTNRMFMTRDEVDARYPGAIAKAHQLIFVDPYVPRFCDEATAEAGKLAGVEVAKMCGQAITGVRERNLLWIVGVRGAAKGTLYLALKTAFGRYVASVKSSIYFTGKQDPAAASPQLARLRHKRIWMTPEMATENTLDAGFLKTIASQTDTVTSRHLHNEEAEWAPQGKIIICGQDVNKIQPLDAAIRERVTIHECKVSFLSTTDPYYDTNNPYHKVADDGILAYIQSPEGLAGFTHALLDMLHLRRTEGYKPNKGMREEKVEWLGQHDMVEMAFQVDGPLEITGNQGDGLSYAKISRALQNLNDGRPLAMSATAIGLTLKRMGLKKDNRSRYLGVRERPEQPC